MANSWLITGGSSGLGLSMGRVVLQNGKTAVLTTRNVAKAQQTAPDIEAKGGKWLQLTYDDPNVEEIVKDTVARFEIDVVVNNAGYAAIAAIEDLRLETIRAQYEANVFGPMRIMQGTIPVFRQRKAGTIINVGSSISYTGMPCGSIYASTKSALRTITQVAGMELAAFGIRVILTEPGRFRTGFGDHGDVAGPEGGFSEPYKDTPVAQVMGHLKNFPPSPGDPDLAAVRMWEIVTKTGLAASDNLKDQWRFPLGPDAVDMLGKAGAEWSEVAEATKAIATSTDFKE